jgi:hypothetical protein
MSHNKSSNPTKSTGAGGWFVCLVWIVTVVLIGITYFSYRYQMNQNGYAHLYVQWLAIVGILLLVAVGFTVRWAGSRRDRTPKK